MQDIPREQWRYAKALRVHKYGACLRCRYEVRSGNKMGVGFNDIYISHKVAPELAPWPPHLWLRCRTKHDAECIIAAAQLGMHPRDVAVWVDGRRPHEGYAKFITGE